MPGRWRIAEPNHRQILRHAAARRLNSAQHGQGDSVGLGEHRSAGRGGSEEPLHGRRHPAHVVLAFGNEVKAEIGVQALLAERAFIASLALAWIEACEHAEEGDAAMAVVEQVLHGGSRSRRIVSAHVGAFDAEVSAGDGDERSARMHEQVRVVARERTLNNDPAVHAALRTGDQVACERSGVAVP